MVIESCVEDDIGILFVAEHTADVDSMNLDPLLVVVHFIKKLLW